ncbi:MAG TPA: hypothetical protein VMJ10_22320 [Kofleriaceae bacterium]|nr:hypothetical protein [Kofleriaceae bacterium]
MLGLFGEVRPGEAATALLLAANIFLILMSYYLVKVAREPLILLGGGAEVKSYSAAVQAILLIFVTMGYSRLAERVSRIKLIGWVTAFFAADLIVFWSLGRAGVAIGVPFFLWAGIFNIVTVAQFWAFAADTYNEEQGKRLFPIIGIGGSLGAISGATVAAPIVSRASELTLMLVAAGVLLASFALAIAVHVRENGRRGVRGASNHQAPVAKGNAFALVARDRYLLVLAALIFVLNIVTKTGDYVLDRMLLARAHGQHLVTADAYIGEFKAHYFEWINVLGVVLQSLFVSRIIKYGGLRAALVAVPLVSLAGYGTALVLPVLEVLLVTRIAESALDYSLSTTVRNALWLVTSREAKYKGKQVVDTFVWRAGDVLSAACVWIGAQVAAGPRAFIVLNVALACAWVAIALFAARAYLSRSPSLARARADRRGSDGLAA